MRLCEIIKTDTGREILIDSRDFEGLRNYRWYIDASGYAQRYKRVGNKNTTEKMHRAIISAPIGIEVDHRNNNKLDNRRHNLRLATRSQNEANKPICGLNSSGYKGVSLYRSKWRAVVMSHGKQKYLGLFENKEEAARVYNAAASSIFGEYANLNVLQGV